MGIENRGWYREELKQKRKSARAAQDEAWSQLQQSGGRQTRWNRRMPKPGEIRHKSKAPKSNGWETEDNAPSWKYLFYWSFAINLILMASMAYLNLM